MQSMKPEAKKIDPSAAARAMRAINSPAQQAASRENGTKGGRPRGSVKPLSELQCTCGGEGLDHKTTCPRGRAIRRRQAQGLPLE
jgi:hypothetical protein